MGKVEDMRRLREQRAAAMQQTARASTPGPAAPRAPRPAQAPVGTATAGTATADPAPAAPPVGPATAPAADEARCGHTSISGRSCTRERDHQKAGTKNHRYG